MAQSRFERPHKPDPIEINQNVIDILVLLARYRYLRSNFIYDLLPDRSKQPCRRHLKKLFRAHLIRRPEQQRQGYGVMHDNLIYEIDRKGWDVLNERDVPYSVAVNLTRSKDEGYVQFPHAMMICDTIASIEIGVRQSGCEFIPLGDILKRATTPNPMKLPCRIYGKDDYIIPDGLFGIRYPSGKVWFYAFEAERSNPLNPKDKSRTSFARKIAAYNHVAANTPYVQQLGIPNLRFLFGVRREGALTNRLEFIKGERERLKSMRIFNRVYLQVVPTQFELYRRPQPFPHLFTEPWHTPTGLQSIAIE